MELNFSTLLQFIHPVLWVLKNRKSEHDTVQYSNDYYSILCGVYADGGSIIMEYKEASARGTNLRIELRLPLYVISKDTLLLRDIDSKNRIRANMFIAQNTEEKLSVSDNTETTEKGAYTIDTFSEEWYFQNSLLHHLRPYQDTKSLWDIYQVLKCWDGGSIDMLSEMTSNYSNSTIDTDEVLKKLWSMVATID